MEKNSKKHMIHFLISAALFFIVTMPFRKFLPVLGVTEVRPASAFPPVFGLLFGVWGALGSAFGNLIADILSGYSPLLCLIGFVAQFLYGYIPYKLWYATPFSSGQIIKLPRLDAVGNVVKYIIIILFDSGLTAGLLALLMSSFKIGNFLSLVTLMMFFNNFVFSMILGIPIFIFITLHEYHLVLPKIRSLEAGKQRKVFFDFSLIIAVVSLFVYPIVAKMLPGKSEFYFLGFSYFFSVFYVCKPVTGKKEQKKEKSHKGMSLNEKLILVFLLIGVITAALIGAVAFMESAYKIEDIVDRWDRIYIYVTLDISIFYLITIAALWYAEKRITVPIETLADMADHYIDQENAALDSKMIIENCQNYNNDKTEVGSFARSFMRMTKEIELYVENITKVTAEKERISAELNVATQIQADMLPRIFPPFPNRNEFDLYASMDPAKEVGGDFYDFFMIGEERLAIVIADVSGKGVPASLFMVISKTLIKNHLQNGDSPEETFIRVNNELCEGNDAMMFVTAWLGVLDINTGEFTYVNAGHNPPLYQKYGKDYEWLKLRPGLVLAAMPGMKYVQETITLTRGDRIFTYTDGIPEAINQKEEEYGNDRLYQYINDTKEQPLKDIIVGLREDISLFVGEADQFDDITMLMLEYNLR